MAAISKVLVARDAAAQLLKREEENWAKQEVGVVLVFAIVGAVAILLISIFIHKKLQARKAAKA
ncbi:hypothetical protein GGTG_07066 [Gaeumannomyces tritici R3-111a-1]|uniref:Uncharacterized protein n=1 Tax=Gaeumannomyces tritici (strain R3-111a-1) TaxID=644352 RepID=J3P0M1_GAET3|nr:hypothetical protein GGTG_07066 [Gaeumannomyces tritici R3-111a-1]EJT77154.1 hypothetical protein GGTG_07066 [Gaeumannomyces tritici R3-111a-1]